MVAAIPDKGIINDFITKFFNSIYLLKAGNKTIVEEFGQGV